jgi:hypothetical protein
MDRNNDARIAGGRRECSGAGDAVQNRRDASAGERGISWEGGIARCPFSRELARVFFETEKRKQARG